MGYVSTVYAFQKNTLNKGSSNFKLMNPFFFLYYFCFIYQHFFGKSPSNLARELVRASHSTPISHLYSEISNDHNFDHSSQQTKREVLIFY